MKYVCFNILLIATSLLLAQCNRGPYVAANKDYKKQVKAYAQELRRNPADQTMSTANPWVGTTNFGMRKPNMVIIHHTAQNTCDQTLKTFTMKKTEVSAHYVICRDGTVHHMLNDYLRAWHAGAGSWGNITDVNSSSIGIELDNNGFEPFPEPQMSSLLTLLDTLKRKYNIPAANFIGHADIAPTRKNDPSVLFEWKRLADKGFGYWWSDTTNTQVPIGFNPKEALRIIGYSIKDTSATIEAFRRKFLQKEGKAPLDEAELKVLYKLYGKYL